MKRSNFLRLNWKDLLKGLILALITAIISFLTAQLETGVSIDLELFKRVGITALIAFLSYLVKNFFTNSNDQIIVPEAKPEPKSTD